MVLGVVAAVITGVAYMLAMTVAYDPALWRGIGGWDMVSRMRMAFLVPVQIFFRGIWQVVPWLLRFINLAFWSYIMTVSSLWEGVPKTTDILAGRWEETAIEAGVDSVYCP